MKDLRKSRGLLPAFALTLCAVSPSLFAGSPLSGDVHAVLQAAHDSGEFNGVALVAERGRILHVAAYGTVGAAPHEPLSVGHRFNIGSIAKEFSAVAVMQLRERRLLSLEDPISRFLPDLPPWAAKVTVRHLLDYTSGVPDMSWRTIKSDADAYADIRRFPATQFDAGKQYAYTYNNVMLRQFIVERITGLSFNAYVRRRIFKPCGMKRALLNALPGTPQLARAFNAERKEDPTDMPVTGIGYLTARDVLDWTQCLHGARVITRESMRVLGRSFEPRNGGLGDTVWDGERLIRHSHDGQSRNFEALMRSDLESGRTFILLGNSKRQKLHRIADAIEARMSSARETLPAQ
jgi:CubicO group peptidase (beta-lactamase class C family)